MAAYILISVLILVTCILLSLIVLVQNPKGGGLASNFSSSNQFMGVRKTADFLEKSTWTLAIALLVLSLASVFAMPKSGRVDDIPQSEILQKAVDEGATAPAPIDYQLPPEE